MSTHNQNKCYRENKLPTPLFNSFMKLVLIASLISIAVIPSVMNAYEQQETILSGG